MSKEFGVSELEDVSDKIYPHEANLLFLDITKAKQKLGWQPKLNIDKTIQWTAEWYKTYAHGDVYDICIKQIHKYEKM